MVNKKIYEDVLDDLEKIEPDVPEEDAGEDTGNEILHRFVCMAPVYVNDPERYERIVEGILSVRADSHRIVHGTHGTNTFTFMFNADEKSLLRILFDVLTRTSLEIYRVYPDDSISQAVRSHEFTENRLFSEVSEIWKWIIEENISTLSGGIVCDGDVIRFIDRTMARRRVVLSRNR